MPSPRLSLEVPVTLTADPPTAGLVGGECYWNSISQKERLFNGVAWTDGGVNSWVATLTNATVATTETVIAQFSLAAGALVAGTFLSLRAHGQVSGTATLAYRVRIGTTGTTADSSILLFSTSAAGVANAYITVDALLQCLTAGVAGTMATSGRAQLVGSGSGPATAAFAPPAVDTSVAQKISLTVVQSVAQTLTSRGAVLNRLM